ncbi:MAG: chemotaxis protein CheW [Pseudomarimonas sp.]
MLALAFDVGELRLALAATYVVEVLHRRELRPLALAPHGVVGLLPFRGSLTPVVDLCQLLLQRDCKPLRSSRLIVLTLPHREQPRLIGLLAENVVDLIDSKRTMPGLRLPNVPWLGEHLADQAELPQLVDPLQLLPDALADLFVETAGA